MALVRAADAIRGHVCGANADQAMGVNMALRAMEEPLRQIVANAGVEASVVVNNLRAEGGAYGFNAQTGAYGDMLGMGIIDPTKVPRSALQNAGSIAALMLTTEVMVAEVPQRRQVAATGAGMDEWDRPVRSVRRPPQRAAGEQLTACARCRSVGGNSPGRTASFRTGTS